MEIFQKSLKMGDNTFEEVSKYKDIISNYDTESDLRHILFLDQHNETRMTGIMRNFIEKYDHTQELTIPKIHENYINATKILRRLTLQKDVLKLNIPHTMYRNHDITNLLAHAVELRLRSIIKHCIITSKLRLDKKKEIIYQYK